jgi:hypothetical protein
VTDVDDGTVELMGRTSVTTHRTRIGIVATGPLWLVAAQRPVSGRFDSPHLIRSNGVSQWVQ